MKRTPPRRRTPRTVPGTAEEILSFIRTHGIEDKDTAAQASAEYRRTVAREKQERKGRYVIDLHGLTSSEAEANVVAGLSACRDRGVREVMVIHGRGLHSSPDEGPVLKNLVLSLLEGKLRAAVKRYRPGIPAEGGEGVTVIFLP
jgi:DNA-nicking Smr family endonuclease